MTDPNPSVATSHFQDPVADWALSQGWLARSAIEEALAANPDLPALTALRQQGRLDGGQLEVLGEIAEVSKASTNMHLKRRLGAGAMGSVYLAETADSGQHVAIKFLRKAVADQAGQRERFSREAEALARLDHPCIPKLIAHGQAGDVPFFAMQYVQGVTLADLLREAGALPESYVLWAAVQVSQALQHANDSAGLIHRDVKPQNIIVELPPDTPPQRLFNTRYPIRIIDFGLARDQVGESSLTMTGMVMGTPLYMSPEQVRSEELDWRADLYALGITMFQLLTGRPPFEGAGPMEVMTAHLHNPIPDPGDEVPSLSRRTCALVMRCMAKQPGERYDSYAEFVEACDRVLAEMDSRPMLLLRKPFVREQAKAKRPGTGSHRADGSGSGTRRGSSDVHQAREQRVSSDVFSQVDEDGADGGGHQTGGDTARLARDRIINAHQRGEGSSGGRAVVGQRSSGYHRRGASSSQNPAYISDKHDIDATVDGYVEDGLVPTTDQYERPRSSRQRASSDVYTPTSDDSGSQNAALVSPSGRTYKPPSGSIPQSEQIGSATERLAKAIKAKARGEITDFDLPVPQETGTGRFRNDPERTSAAFLHTTGEQKVRGIAIVPLLAILLGIALLVLALTQPYWMD